jgi:peptide/nickel transport system substrate-binding protein
MIYRKKSRFTAGILCAALIVAGCSDDDDAGDVDDVAATTEASASPDTTAAEDTTEDTEADAEDTATTTASTEADADADSEGGGGGVLIAAIPEDFDAIDPHTGSGESPSVWLSLVFETLVAIDKNAEPVPGLAESWEFSDDGLTATFHLREGVTFHDGTPFTSEAVKFSYERIKDPTTAAVSQSVFSIVDSIDTPDDLTVVLNLTQPSGSLLADLSQQGRSAIISPADVGSDGQIIDHVGTGPFTFTSYTVSDRLVLGHNPDYWAGPAVLDGIEVRIIPDESARLAALQGNEIHFAWNVSGSQAQPLADSGDIQMQEAVSNRANFFSFNTTKAPFDNVDVRQALTLAVSRDDIASAGWDGFADPTFQPFNPDSFWYMDDELRTSANMDEAKALLEGAGVTGGAITIKQWDALGSDLEAQIVASAWQELGFDVTIEKIDIGTLVEQATAGDFDVVYLWVGQILDPNRPYSFFQSESARNGIVGLYNSPELDQLIADGLAEIDPDARKEIYGTIVTDYILADAPVMYTVRPFQFVGLSNDVTGYEQGVAYVFYDNGGMLTAAVEGG